MLLGKCPRHQFRRTTSMAAITFNIDHNIDSHHNNNIIINQQQEEGSLNYRSNGSNYGFYNEHDQRFFAATTLSPRNVPTRRSTGDFLETSHFLSSCGFCHRGLAPGKDIYMYRGDTGFCSLECREKQMKHDEKKIFP